jgi:hypothetical protein
MARGVKRAGGKQLLLGRLHFAEAARAVRTLVLPVFRFTVSNPGYVNYIPKTTDALSVE